MPQDNPSITLLRQYLLQGEIRKAKESGASLDLTAEFDFLSFAIARCRTNYSQLAQDLWVLFELGELRNGYFVEFGAGDGVLLSNTYLLERSYGWRGVLAEPNREFHAALQRNRSAYISTKCVVGKSDGDVLFNQTKDPHFSTLQAYSDKDFHAAKRISGEVVLSEAQTLTDLLKEANAPRRIDYLSMDTEGNEFDILMGFEFSEFVISLISVEHNHTDNDERIERLLRTRGFIRRFATLSDFDGWYINENLEER